MIPEGGEQVCQDLMETARQGWDREAEAVLAPARPAQEQRLALRCGTGFLGFCRGFFGAQRLTPQEEGIILSDRVSALEGELAATREQLASLRKDAKGKAE
jgi:hypothetical protein